MNPKSRVEQIEELRIELASFVAYRHRRGQEYTFRQALLGHREQVEENMRDDTDPLWRDRLSLLDELCLAEGLR